MRLVYIITQGECGGAQKNVRDLAILTKLQGHEVFVLTGRQESDKDAWLFNELKNDGFKPYQLIIIESLQRNINPILDAKAFISLFKMVKNVQPHIVHIHSTKAGILASIAAKLARAKVIYTVHGFVFSEPLPYLKKFFYIFSEYVAAFFRNLTITVSEFDKKIGEHYRVINRHQDVVIYNGIDPDKRSAILDKQSARKFILSKLPPQNQNYFLIGVVANLYKTKGIEFLIEAAKILQSENKKLIFVVIGDGDLRQELQGRINRHLLHDTFFLIGSIPDAYKYLRAFDLMVLPSVKEGFPYILLESLLAQVPFIATRVGGIPELERYLPVHLVQPADATELYEAIKKDLAKQDNTRETLPEEFTTGNMFKKTMDQYKRVAHIPTLEPKNKTFLITLPAYNEEEIIEVNVKKVSSYINVKYQAQVATGRIKLCVAINGSDDQTENILKKLEKSVNFLSHTVTSEKGRGRALTKTWSKGDEDVLIYIDSDLAYDLSDLGKMIDSHLSNEGYDLVVASRRVDGSIIKRSPMRNFLTQGYNILIKVLFLNRFTDAQAGCKSITRYVYNEIQHNVMKHSGWFFDTALLIYSEKKGYKIKDLQITCIENRKWRLKIIGTVFYFLKNLLTLRISTLFKGYNTQ